MSNPCIATLVLWLIAALGMGAALTWAWAVSIKENRVAPVGRHHIRPDARITP